MLSIAEKTLYHYLRTFVGLLLGIKVWQSYLCLNKGTMMIQLGKFNKLKVLKEVDFGVYLDAGSDEILMPQKYVPDKTQVGDTVDVFIYRDSEDRLIATNLQPKACVDDLAYLQVVDTNRFGVFLDWGLEKDLFVPFSEQNSKMERGKWYVVKVILDDRTDRIIASARIEKFLKYIPEGLSENQEVDLLPFELTDLGVKAVVNDQFLGMLYHNEIFKTLRLGEPIKGYIKKLRSDYKIDLSLQKSGYEEVLDSKEVLWEKLKSNQGFLPLTDKSEPEEIYAQLQMSKKNFKKAVGGLFRDRRISIQPDGIHLVPED
jgi:predicted RNA-binding protein (virulence factor B family)